MEPDIPVRPVLGRSPLSGRIMLGVAPATPLLHDTVVVCVELGSAPVYPTVSGPSDGSSIVGYDFARLLSSPARGIGGGQLRIDFDGVLGRPVPSGLFS